MIDYTVLVGIVSFIAGMLFMLILALALKGHDPYL